MADVAWLSWSDLHRFATDGYLVVEKVVGEALLEAADDEVGRVIHEVLPAEGDGGPGANLWFLACSRLPRCDDLLRRSPALAIAEELVAPSQLDHAFEQIQIATTIPSWSHRPGGPHIDGHAPGQDPPASFTLLAAVFLTDQQMSNSGNLWVWPGSHLDHQRLFYERGTKVLQGTGGHCTLLDPPLDLNKPVEVAAKRGDLLLAHYLLGHNKGGNTGNLVRKTVYYRLSVPHHTDRWESTFLEPWTEYPPIRGLFPS